MAFKRSAVCFRLREDAGRGASRIFAKAFVFFRFQRFFFRFERTKNPSFSHRFRWVKLPAQNSSNLGPNNNSITKPADTKRDLSEW